MIFVSYPKCSTCQKAKKWLELNGFDFEERNIKENKLSFDELNDLHKKSQLPIGKFFNSSGLVYKSLNLKDKLNDMSLNEKLELLSSDGMLVKRPIIIMDDFILIGFKEKEWTEKLSD